MITSTSDDKVNYVRELQNRKSVRHSDRRLVMEGVRLVEEVASAGVVPTFVLYTEALTTDSRGKALLATLRALSAPCHAVSEAVMQHCSDTVTPQGILAVLPFPELPRPAHPTFTLILDSIRDPGNLGTILRTSLAAGVEQVLLAPGTVDFSNPKVVRAAMGAHLHLPMADAGWDEIGGVAEDCDVWLASAGGDRFYSDVDWTRPTALIVGSEAHGAGKRAKTLAQGSVSIPISPRVDSLNAAVAAAVILFEVARQRRAREHAT